MGLGKLAGIVMLPLGLLIVMEYAGIFALNIGFDKVIIGSMLMIALQLFNVIMAKVHNGHIGIMSIAIFTIVAVPGLLYIFSGIISIPGTIGSLLPLIIGIMMVLESIYTMH